MILLYFHEISMFENYVGILYHTFIFQKDDYAGKYYKYILDVTKITYKSVSRSVNMGRVDIDIIL